MIDADPLPACTAFCGFRRLASGPLTEVALAARAAIAQGLTAPVHIYEDASGRLVDLALDGSEAELLARLRELPRDAATRGRGRPRLGVVAREVTLRPSDWEWLNAQPGGASVALRRLVESARRADRSGPKEDERE